MKKTFDRAVGFFRSRKKVLFVIAVVSIILVFNVWIATWVTSSRRLMIPSEGIIGVTEVVASGGDLESKNGAVYVNWGTLIPGESKSASFYVRSISRIPIILAFNLTDWVPVGLSPYMALSWNYSGAELASWGRSFRTIQSKRQWLSRFCRLSDS